MRPDVADLDNELRDWKIIDVNNPDLQTSAVIRLRMCKPPLPEGCAFSCAVEITWPYSSADQYPAPDVNQKQLSFERALDDLSGMNGFSELVQVWTGMGTKEWLYYTSNQRRFMTDFNALLSGHEHYPIEIKFYDDPEWQIWSQTVEAVESKSA